MEGLPESSTPHPAPLRMLAGEDRFGKHRSLGISRIEFKLMPQDSGGPLVLENRFHGRGGPARHLHHEQDEWFYILQGAFSHRPQWPLPRLAATDAVSLQVVFRALRCSVPWPATLRTPSV